MRLSLKKSLVDSFGLHIREVLGSVENRDKNSNKNMHKPERPNSRVQT